MKQRASVLVISNDVIPGMGVPVAAPGLRAWGIARGLRLHGYDVTLAVDANVVRRAWGRDLPWPTPRGVLVVRPSDFEALLASLRPEFVVITNSNHIDVLRDLAGAQLIFDFFAPKMLEMQSQVGGDTEHVALQELRRRKLMALAKSDAVIVNGAKKIGYVREWIRLAGRDPDVVPTEIVVMPLPVVGSAPAPDGPVHAVLSGYIQPWSQPGAWSQVVEPFLRRGELVLHMLVGTHWGGRGHEATLPETFASLERMPGVRQHGVLEFEDFQRFLAGCHVSIDLFERGAERELAMVTRTAVSLASGLAVVHVPFTETSELIREYDAGWLVDSNDGEEITRALESAVLDRDTLTRKRSGARALAEGVLEHEVATLPLSDLIERLR